MDITGIKALAEVLRELPDDVLEKALDKLKEVDTTDLLYELGKDFGRGLRDGFLKIEKEG